MPRTLRNMLAATIFLLVLVPVEIAAEDYNDYLTGAVFGVWGWCAVGAVRLTQ